MFIRLAQFYKQAIVTLVERKSDFALLAKLSIKMADLVFLAIEAKFKSLCSRVKTLTVDNGKEFADHQDIDKSLGIQTYFADPYCSRQRGSDDNFPIHSQESAHENCHR